MPRSSTATAPGERPARPDANGTRERILNIALDLFVEKGYDKTSLREIAEELGFSKAALYYHFASKEDILMALHLRLHQLGEDAFARLGELPASASGWGALLQELVDDMLANRKLLVLHERNFQNFREIADKHPHDHENLAIEDSFRHIMGDDRIPLVDRVRLIGALGSLAAGLLAYTTLFADTPVDEYGALLRDLVAAIIPVGSAQA